MNPQEGLLEATSRPSSEKKTHRCAHLVMSGLGAGLEPAETGLWRACECMGCVSWGWQAEDRDHTGLSHCPLYSLHETLD